MKFNKLIFLLILILLALRCSGTAASTVNDNQTKENKRLRKECERLSNERDKYFQEMTILRKNVDQVIDRKLTIYYHLLSEKVWKDFWYKIRWFAALLTFAVGIAVWGGYLKLSNVIESKIEKNIKEEIAKKEEDIRALTEQMINGVVDFKIKAERSLDSIKTKKKEVEKTGDEAVLFFKDSIENIKDGNKENIEKISFLSSETDEIGRTFLHYASYFGQLEIAKTLLSKGFIIEAVDNDGNAPLNLAAKAGRDEVVKHLILQGADIETKNNYGWRPLHQAARNGHLGICRIFIDKKADINIKNNDEQTPLHKAVIEEQLEIVKLLVDNGCAVNEKDINNWTPLLLAVIGGYTEIAKILIKNKADVNAKSNNGSSVLHYAVLGNKDIVELLLKTKVKTKIKNLDGETPLSLAVYNDFSEIAELLRKHGIKE